MTHALRVSVAAIVGVLAGLLISPAVSYGETIVYQSDFSSGAGPEWSNPTTTTSPSGETFLGRFGAELQTLTLENLPAHDSIHVGFRLYIIGPWDGNGGPNDPDPDIFTLDNIGPNQSNILLLNTTFSNVDGLNQQWPANGVPGDNPPRSSSFASDTLGYPDTADTTYAMGFSFAHSDSTAIFNWLAFVNGILTAPGDELWGLDDVEVSVFTAVPEPASLILAISGVAALPLLRRFRKQPASVA